MTAHGSTDQMDAHSRSHVTTPLPNTIFTWTSYFKESATALEAARQKSYAALLRPSNDDLNEKAELLVDYACQLSAVFTKDSPHPARRPGFQLTWVFPGEPVRGVASMACAFPAFEALCSLSAAAILLFRSLLTDQSPQTARRCIQVATMASSRSALLSEPQWNRLRRQGLPLQLTRGWLLSLAQLASHTHSVAQARLAVVHVASNMRAAEDSACELMCVRRECLCGDPFVTADQKRSLQSDYDQAHELYAQLLCTCSTLDAENALHDASTHPYVEGLVLLATRACESLTASTASNLLAERWAIVRDINQLSTVQQIVDLDEIVRWRSETLPSTYVYIRTE